MKINTKLIIKINTKLIIGFLILLVLVQGYFLVQLLDEPEYPQEAYVKIMQGNICVQTQQPIWEWIEQQRGYLEIYGKITEKAC